MADEPTFPLPRQPLGNCAECIHWLERNKQTLYYAPRGDGTVAKLSADQVRAQVPGGLIPGDMPRHVNAPCTFNPIWHMIEDGWWCGQWKAKPPH